MKAAATTQIKERRKVKAATTTAVQAGETPAEAEAAADMLAAAKKLHKDQRPKILHPRPQVSSMQSHHKATCWADSI